MRLFHVCVPQFWCFLVLHVWRVWRMFQVFPFFVFQISTFLLTSLHASLGVFHNVDECRLCSQSSCLHVCECFSRFPRLSTTFMFLHVFRHVGMCSCAYPVFIWHVYTCVYTHVYTCACTDVYIYVNTKREEVRFRDFREWRGTWQIVQYAYKFIHVLIHIGFSWFTGFAKRYKLVGVCTHVVRMSTHVYHVMQFCTELGNVDEFANIYRVC